MDVKKKKVQGNILIIIGLLLIAAALVIVAKNIIHDIRAGQHSDEILAEIYEKTLGDIELKEYNMADYDSADDPSVPDYVKFPNMALPVGEYYGLPCVGVLKIPVIDKEFPLIGELNDYNLGYGPCLYYGSPYKNNLVIGAHNNSSHFGDLIREVKEGDQITVVDMAGNVFNYTVKHTEVLAPYETEKMIHSDWDLSLFTCTFDLSMRYTVRCVRSDSNAIIIDVA